MLRGGGGGEVAAAVAAAGGGRCRAGRGGAGGVWCNSSTWDGDVPVTPQRQVPAVFFRRRGGASNQFLDRALDSPVMQRRFTTVQTVLKKVDISQVPFVDKVVDCPLLCSLGDGPGSAIMRSSGQGC